VDYVDSTCETRIRAAITIKTFIITCYVEYASANNERAARRSARAIRSGFSLVVVLGELLAPALLLPLPILRSVSLLSSR